MCDRSNVQCILYSVYCKLYSCWDIIKFVKIWNMVIFIDYEGNKCSYLEVNYYIVDIMLAISIRAAGVSYVIDSG